MGLFGSKDITGIDIGSGSIKVVRIEGGGRRPRLLSVGIAELSLDPLKAGSVGADLKYLLYGKRFRGKNNVTLMPGKDLTIRSLALPKMPQAELREAVRWESKRHISYPLESAIVEFLVLGERREGMADKYDILMVAAERGTVVEHLSPFREAAITVTAVDANPLALRNSLGLREKDDKTNTLVVDIGAGKTEMDIFKGGALRFSRCLETGGRDMTRAIAERLGIGLENAEAVKRKTDLLSSAEDDAAAAAVKGVLDGVLLEIRRSAEYYKATFREKGVGRMILTGGVSLMNSIKDYFSLSFDMPIELDDPFAGLAYKKKMMDEATRSISPRFSSAVGLAMRKA